MSLTRYAPFRRSPPGYCYPALPLDLHVLSLPLAFILSQDQTLLCIIHIFPVRPRQLHSSKKKNQRSHFVLGTCCTNLSILSMNFPVISETGCKDSDFFVPSKLFLTFFFIFTQKLAKRAPILRKIKKITCPTHSDEASYFRSLIKRSILIPDGRLRPHFKDKFPAFDNVGIFNVSLIVRFTVQGDALDIAVRIT